MMTSLFVFASSMCFFFVSFADGTLLEFSSSVVGSYNFSSLPSINPLDVMNISGIIPMLGDSSNHLSMFNTGGSIRSVVYAWDCKSQLVQNSFLDTSFNYSQTSVYSNSNSHYRESLLLENHFLHDAIPLVSEYSTFSNFTTFALHEQFTSSCLDVDHHLSSCSGGVSENIFCFNELLYLGVCQSYLEDLMVLVEGDEALGGWSLLDVLRDKLSYIVLKLKIS